MGLICCKPETSTSRTDAALNNSLMDGITYPEINLTEARQLQFGQDLDLYTLFTEKAITTLLQRAGDYLVSPDVKKNDKLLINEKLQLMKNDFKLWVKLSNQERVPYKLHTYYSEMMFPFTPELLYLFYLNENSDNFEKLHNDLDHYEVVHQTFKGDYCLMLLRYRTKGVVTIEPRSFFVLRVVRRNKDRTFNEFQVSVLRTHLGELPAVKAIRDAMENEATVYIHGSEFESTPEGYMLKSFTKVDVLSQLGILAVKPVIKSSAKQTKNTLMHMLVEFLLVKQDLAKLKWFGDSLSDKRRIFDENLKILGEAKLDLTCLEPDLQSIYVSKYAWKKKKPIDNFIKREVDGKQSGNELYETVENINDDKDKLIADINNKIDAVAKQLEKKVEQFKSREIERKLSTMTDEVLKQKVTKQIDDINHEIEKRSNATKEMLENSYNEGSYVEDMERKVNMDLHKLSEQLNYQLKKVAKKSMSTHAKEHILRSGVEDNRGVNVLRSDSLSELPVLNYFTVDDVADGEETKDQGEAAEDVDDVPKVQVQEAKADEGQDEAVEPKVEVHKEEVDVPNVEVVKEEVDVPKVEIHEDKEEVPQQHITDDPTHLTVPKEHNEQEGVKNNKKRKRKNKK